MKVFKAKIWQDLGVQIAVMLPFLCACLLFDYNMGGGGWNEIDVLPLARQFATPDWIPSDWYLNQPPGYRLLFQSLFGPLAATWGFLAASIIGRIFYYAIFTVGIVLLARKIGLSLSWLLLALALFLGLNCQENGVDCQQGAIAREWLLGGLEAKALAYSLVMPAIWLMLTGRYRWMALCLGLATSFHVLVGGWAFLSAIGWLLLRQKIHRQGWRSLALIPLIYVVGSAFAIKPVFDQLFAPFTPTEIPPSYVYVFLRLPHHLNPLTWSFNDWLRPLATLLILAGSVTVIRRRHQQKFSQQAIACFGLAEFTLLTLVPLVLGLIAAPFDRQGYLLQFYPFRLGDVLLPLNACLLTAAAIEQSEFGKKPQLSRLFCLCLLGFALYNQPYNLYQDAIALQRFPSENQDVNPAWQDLCNWIRQNTPKDAVIITPPAAGVSFSWLAERPTIAKFKLFPQTKAGIVGWYERLGDLSGDPEFWQRFKPTKDNRFRIQEQLSKGYDQLKPEQVVELMQKYQADYFVTHSKHQLPLPIAYRVKNYVLYTRSNVGSPSS